MNLSVDVISDVICPWCFIGKRRLEKAIAALGGPVKVRWLPFQLNPHDAEGRDQPQGIPHEEVRKLGAVAGTRRQGGCGRRGAEGIHFAFDRIERTPNTLDAHRLIWLADKEGVQDAVVEALFRAYFTEGRDISNRQTLLDVVAEAGLDRSKAEAVLNSDDGLEAIKEADELARRFRVEGVPFFIINGKVTLSGAQPPDAFLEAFRQALGPQ